MKKERGKKWGDNKLKTLWKRKGSWLNLRITEMLTTEVPKGRSGKLEKDGEREFV